MHWNVTSDALTTVLAYSILPSHRVWWFLLVARSAWLICASAKQHNNYTCSHILIGLAQLTLYAVALQLDETSHENHRELQSDWLAQKYDYWGCKTKVRLNCHQILSSLWGCGLEMRLGLKALCWLIIDMRDLDMYIRHDLANMGVHASLHFTFSCLLHD